MTLNEMVFRSTYDCVAHRFSERSAIDKERNRIACVPERLRCDNGRLNAARQSFSLPLAQ
jgi:hypothetical protein